MREIKFKCIVTGNNKEKIAEFTEWLDGDGWKHDYYAPLVTNGVFSHEELGDGWFGEIIRSEFTGLKDKNKKEIYEGDILKSKSWNENSRIQNPYHVVKWGYCGWKAEGYNGNMKVSPDLDVKSDFEIIGNIYEHPNLLK